MGDGEPLQRYEVVVEDGPPQGDLFDLEQTTTYQVMDRLSGKVALSVQGGWRPA